MARISLAQIKEEVRDRADLHKDGNVISDSEMTRYVTRAFHELYDLMITADDARTFTKNAGLLSQAGDHVFTLPSDCYRIVSVYSKAVGYYRQGTKADSAVYPLLADAPQDAYSEPTYFYRWNPVSGERLLFIFPTPKSQKLALTYFPQPPEFTDDDDEIDNPVSWIEYVVVSVAIKCLSKIERDASSLLLEKKELTRRIKKGISNLDLSGPTTIRRTAFPGHNYRWNRGL